MDKVNLETALTEINQNCSKNFKEALDIAVNLGIDPKKTDQAVRGATNLPHGNGKTYKVAVFAEGEEAKDALDNGADKVGMEDLAEDMKKRRIRLRCYYSDASNYESCKSFRSNSWAKGINAKP